MDGRLLLLDWMLSEAVIIKAALPDTKIQSAAVETIQKILLFLIPQ